MPYSLSPGQECHRKARATKFIVLFQRPASMAQEPRTSSGQYRAPRRRPRPRPWQPLYGVHRQLRFPLPAAAGQTARHRRGGSSGPPPRRSALPFCRSLLLAAPARAAFFMSLRVIAQIASGLRRYIRRKYLAPSISQPEITLSSSPLSRSSYLRPRTTPPSTSIKL